MLPCGQFRDRDHKHCQRPQIANTTACLYRQVASRTEALIILVQQGRTRARGAHTSRCRRIVIGIAFRAPTDARKNVCDVAPALFFPDEIRTSSRQDAPARDQRSAWQPQRRRPSATATSNGIAIELLLHGLNIESRTSAIVRSLSIIAGTRSRECY